VLTTTGLILTVSVHNYLRIFGKMKLINSLWLAGCLEIKDTRHRKELGFILLDRRHQVIRGIFSYEAYSHCITREIIN